MNLIIIGIDHLLQKSNACLKNFIATITESEQPTLIGEEAAGDTVARQVAGSKGIRWIEIEPGGTAPHHPTTHHRRDWTALGPNVRPSNGESPLRLFENDLFTS
jgi:hypothetical protein